MIIPDGVTDIIGGAFYRSNISSVTIPDGVKTIGESAFYYCKNLTSVTIPDGVKTIGRNAFYYCSDMTSVTIPSSVDFIGDHAFSHCIALTQLDIQGEQTEFESSAFSDCTGLAEDGFVIIRNVMYCYCGSTMKITIPRNVTKISSGVIPYDSNVISVTVGDSVETIEDGAFYSSITLKGRAGSAAEAYATEHNIPFKAVSFYNTSALTSNRIFLGTSVYVNCSSEFGIGNVTYAVYYRKVGKTNWTTVRDFKSLAAVEVRPAAAVDYEIKVSAKDSTGKIANKILNLTVIKYPSNSSTLSRNTITLGEKVKVRCSCSDFGGFEPFTYTVQYKKTSSSKWTTVAEKSSKTVFVIKPGAATTYDVCVTINFPDRSTIKKTLKLTVTKK